MLSIEIRINTLLTAHIFARRVKTNADDCQYRYTYYEPETGHVVSDEITHAPEYGCNSLVRKILEAMEVMK